jgi:hypothetical protein
MPAGPRSNRCEPAGPLNDGDPCGVLGQDQCGPGAICLVPLDAPATCHRLCGEDVPCPPGLRCMATLPLGGRTIDLCRP